MKYLQCNVLIISLLISTVCGDDIWFEHPVDAEKWQERTAPLNKTSWALNDPGIRTEAGVRAPGIQGEGSKTSRVDPGDQVDAENDKELKPRENKSNEEVSSEAENAFGNTRRIGSILTSELPGMGWKPLQDGISHSTREISESDWNKLSEDGFLMAKVPGWNQRNPEGSLKLPEEYKPHPEEYHSQTSGYQPHAEVNSPYPGGIKQYPEENQTPDGYQPHFDVNSPYPGEINQYPEGNQPPGGYQPHFEVDSPYPGEIKQYPEGNQPPGGYPPNIEVNKPYPENINLYSEEIQVPGGYQPHADVNKPYPEEIQQYPEANQPSSGYQPQFHSSQLQLEGQKSYIGENLLQPESYQSLTDSFQQQPESYQLNFEGHKTQSKDYQFHSGHEPQPGNFQILPEGHQLQPENYQPHLEGHQPQSEAYRPQPESYHPQPGNYQPQPKHYQSQSKTYQPQPKNHQPQPGNYQPQPENYQPQPENYQPQPENYQPQVKNDQPQTENYQPQLGRNYQPQPESYQPQGKTHEPHSENHQPGYQFQNVRQHPQPEIHQPQNFKQQPQSESYQVQNEKQQPEPEGYRPQPESYTLSQSNGYQPQLESYQPQPTDYFSHPEGHNLQPEISQQQYEGYQSPIENYPKNLDLNQPDSVGIQNYHGGDQSYTNKDCTQGVNQDCYGTWRNGGNNNNQRWADDERNRQAGRQTKDWNAEKSNSAGVKPERNEQTTGEILRPPKEFPEEIGGDQRRRTQQQNNDLREKPWITNNNYPPSNYDGHLQNVALGQSGIAGPSNFGENSFPANIGSGGTGGNNVGRPIINNETPLPFENRNPQGSFKGENEVIYQGNRNPNEDLIPGTPGVDYPNYASLPNTNFDCRKQDYAGYFADVETQCQMYHICQADGRQNSFLCPTGTIFNQKLFTCDWWYNYDCSESSNYYSLNVNVYRRGTDVQGNFKGSNHQGSILSPQQFGPRQPNVPLPAAGFGVPTGGNSEGTVLTGIAPVHRNEIRSENANVNEHAPTQSGYNRHLNGQGRIEQVRNDFNSFAGARELPPGSDSGRRQNDVGMNVDWSSAGHPAGDGRGATFDSGSRFPAGNAGKLKVISTSPEFWMPGGPRVDDLNKWPANAYDSAWITKRQDGPTWNFDGEQSWNNQLKGEDGTSEQNAGFAEKSRISPEHNVGDIYHENLNPGIRRIGDDINGGYEFIVGDRNVKEGGITEDNAHDSYGILIEDVDKGIKELSTARTQKKYGFPIKEAAVVESSSPNEGIRPRTEKGFGILATEEGGRATLDKIDLKKQETAVRPEESVNGREEKYSVSLPETSESRTLGQVTSEESPEKEYKVHATPFKARKVASKEITENGEERSTKEIKQATQNRSLEERNMNEEIIATDTGTFDVEVDSKKRNSQVGKRIGAERQQAWAKQSTRGTTPGSSIPEENRTSENEGNVGIATESVTDPNRKENATKSEDRMFVQEENRRNIGKQKGVSMDEISESRAPSENGHYVTDDSLQEEEAKGKFGNTRGTEISQTKREGSVVKSRENNFKPKGRERGEVHDTQTEQIFASRFIGSGKLVLRDKSIQREENIAGNNGKIDVLTESTKQPRLERNGVRIVKSSPVPKRNASESEEVYGVWIEQRPKNTVAESDAPVAVGADILEKEVIARNNRNTGKKGSTTRSRQEGIVRRSKDHISIIKRRGRGEGHSSHHTTKDGITGSYSIGEVSGRRGFGNFDVPNDSATPSGFEGNLTRTETIEIEYDENEGRSEKYFDDSTDKITENKAVTKSLVLPKGSESRRDEVFGSKSETVAGGDSIRVQGPEITVEENTARSEERYRAVEELGRGHYAGRPEGILKTDKVYSTDDAVKEIDVPRSKFLNITSESGRRILEPRIKKTSGELKSSESKLNRLQSMHRKNFTATNATDVVDVVDGVSSSTSPNVINGYELKVDNTSNSTDINDSTTSTNGTDAESTQRKFSRKNLNSPKNRSETVEKWKILGVLGERSDDVFKRPNATETKNFGVYRRLRLVMPVRDRNPDKLLTRRTEQRNYSTLNNRNPRVTSL